MFNFKKREISKEQIYTIDRQINLIIELLYIGKKTSQDLKVFMIIL